MNLLFWYVGVVAPASVLVPISCALWRYRFIDHALKIILTYLFIAGLTNAAASALAFSNRNNLFLLHFYTAIEFALLSLYFLYLIKKKHFRWVIISIMLIFLFTCIYNAFYIQDIKQFNTYTRSLQAVILPSYGFYYLYQRIGTHHGHALNKAHYWVVIGLIIYFFSSLIQFSFSNFLSANLAKEFRIWLWTLHASIVLVMYMFFAKAYILCKDER